MTKQLWLADTLRARGLVVVETAGWQSRGAEMTTITGVICHHTASAVGSGDCPSLHTVTNGRADLAGPLCQVLLGRSGACYIIAAGKANHAGAGSYHGIAALGNAGLLGIEAENSGLGEPWNASQMRAYATLAAALANHCGLAAEQVCAHYEWAKDPVGRKIDPAGPWIGGGDWYSGGLWQTGTRTATAHDFRVRVGMWLDSWKDDALTQEEHNLLVQAAADAAYTKHKVDDYFGIDAQGNAKDIRKKIDQTFIHVSGEDHRDLIAGRVAAIDKTVNPTTAPPARV